MEMVEVRTEDLEGTALRFAVASADGLLPELRWSQSDLSGVDMCMWTDNHGYYAPDTEWDIAGPLIVKYGISIIKYPQYFLSYTSGVPDCYGTSAGHTQLIAACRAIVHAKLGETVLVPKELVK